MVIAQNYNDSDKRDGVDYEMYDKGIGPSKARNVILEKFYNSSDNWLFMLDDDDVIIYEYYDIEKFIYNCYYGKYDKYNLGVIVPLMPERCPFKEMNIKNDVMHYYSFIPSPLDCCPNMMLLRKNNNQNLSWCNHLGNNRNNPLGNLRFPPMMSKCS